MKKITASIAAFFLPLAARAQDLGGSLLNVTAEKNAGYKNTSIDAIIGTVITALLAILGVIFLVLIVYAGYIWMIARGDEAKVEQSKNTIINSTIGLVIVLGAYAITNYVVSALLTTTVK
jgi:heme/copper-type cytochrome/quinol oxidase subunit 2